MLGGFGSGTLPISTQDGTYLGLGVCLKSLYVTARHPSRAEYTHAKLFHVLLAFIVNVPIIDKCRAAERRLYPFAVYHVPLSPNGLAATQKGCGVGNPAALAERGDVPSPLEPLVGRETCSQFSSVPGYAVCGDLAKTSQRASSLLRQVVMGSCFPKVRAIRSTNRQSVT